MGPFGILRSESDLVCIGDYNEIFHVEEHDGVAQTNERQKTWVLLKFLRSKSNLPWVCIGEILHVEEHDGVGQRDKRQMLGFREAVDVTGSV